MGWEVCARCNQRRAVDLDQMLCASCLQTDPSVPTVPWELTDADVITLRIARIDPEKPGPVDEDDAA